MRRRTKSTHNDSGRPRMCFSQRGSSRRTSCYGPRLPRPVAKEAGGRLQAGREIAVAARRAHLEAGYEVTVPQFLDRPDFLAELENAASAARSPR
jgi:hypothetical protein